MEKGMHQNHQIQTAGAGHSLAAATTGRRANNFYADYLSVVNAEMLALAGVKYVDHYRSLNGSLEAMKTAADHGADPRDFSDDVIREFGLKRCEPGNDPDEVERHNRVKAAIVEYARVTRETAFGDESDKNPGKSWTFGIDGNVYLDVDGGLISMVPVPPPGGGPCWIGILRHDGASLDYAMPRDVGVGERIACEYDIGEAVEAAKVALENTNSMKF